MKKHLPPITLLICMISIIFLASCGVRDEIEPEPEPYTKMVESINNEDLTHARKYANLVIQDFPESDYIYNAYLIKNMILCSKLQLQYAKSSFLCEGVDNLNTFLLEQSDIDTMEKYVGKTISRIDKLNKPFNKTLKYLLEHYDEDAEKIKLNFPEQAEGDLFYDETDLQSLSWFASAGYPIPTETDMYGGDAANTIKIFRQVRNGYSGDEAFSYLRYFDTTLDVCTDDDLLKSVCNKIIEMTENDKYNEYRLDAEEFLEKIE